MENLWFWAAIVTLISSWIHAFLSKVQADFFKNSNIFIFWGYFVLMITSLFLIILKGDFTFNYQVVLASLTTTLLVVLYLKTRIETLKYLSSSTYFINFRIWSSIFLLIIWVSFFKETLLLKDYLGILVWITVFLLLFEKKKKSESKKDLYFWIFLLILSIFWWASHQIVSKYINIEHISFYQYLFFQSVFWIFTTIIMNRWKMKNLILLKNKESFMFLILVWMIFTIICYWNNLAFFYSWDLVVVYKVVSYSIFIPIILSAIFLKEKLNFRQILAIVLSFVSLYLFF